MNANPPADRDIYHYSVGEPFTGPHGPVEATLSVWLTSGVLNAIAVKRNITGLTDRDERWWEAEQEAWWDAGCHDQCLAKDEHLAAMYEWRGMTCG